MSARWTLITLLLAPAVVVPLLVPLYDRKDPELFGFPFFYWFQLSLIFFAVLVTVIAYRLSLGDRADRVDRAERQVGDER